jgi:uncharacterized protein YjbJ (UPF0337 family)
MRIGRIDLNKLRGVSDKALGLGKELAGVLVGSDRRQEEGEAQQARATESLKALRKELEAQPHEAKADAMAQRQRAAKQAKSRS